MHLCINCGSDKVERQGDDFTCHKCQFHWDVALEQANKVYLRSQGRHPATSVLETGNGLLTVTPGQDGAPIVTTGDPVNGSPVEQAATGEVEKLPEVPKAEATAGDGQSPWAATGGETSAPPSSKPSSKNKKDA